MIRMFLGLPDPDPLVRGRDPVLDPYPSFSPKGVERTKIMLAKLNFNTNFSQKFNFKTEVLAGKFNKNMKKKFLFHS
jgi:hypothetical protein